MHISHTLLNLIAAPTETDGGPLNTAGLTALIETIIFFALLAVAGLAIWAARRGNISKGFSVVVGVFFGLLILGFAYSRLYTSVGSNILTTIFSG